MTQPTSTFAYVSNMFIKLINLEHTGDVETTHKHEFDHITLLASGSVNCEIEKDNVINSNADFKAPHLIYIEEGVLHKFTALEDNTVLVCLHTLKDKYRKLIDPSEIPEDSNPFDIIMPFIR